MREPFLLGLSMIALWAVFAWRRQRRLALGVFIAASLVMLAFSSRAAIVVIGALLVCAWIEYFDEIATQRWKWLGWAALAAAALAMVVLGGEWMKLATSYDAGLSIRQSGMVQKIISQLGDDFRVPFVTVYGLVQPVLPAALVDPAPLVWKIIALLRSFGWYLLAPVLLYAAFSSWRARSEKDRRMLIWFALAALLWVVLASARAGGDQWDNPRYRVIFLPFIAILTAWGWLWSREKRDAWIWAWVGADFVFVTFFLSWYLSRYTGGAFAKLPVLADGRHDPGDQRRAAGSRLAVEPQTPGQVAPDRIQDVLAEPENLPGAQSLCAGCAAALPAQPAWRSKRINRWDGLVVVFFIGFAVLYFLGRLQSNYPVLILSGDAGNLASFAAAQAQPDLFRGDPALGEANLTGYYATIHIPIIKALAPLAGGDYAWAYTWLVLPTSSCNCSAFTSWAACSFTTVSGPFCWPS